MPRRDIEACRAPCGEDFMASAQTATQTTVRGALVPCAWHHSEAVDIDRGQFVRRRMKDVAVVMGLAELTATIPPRTLRSDTLSKPIETANLLP